MPKTNPVTEVEKAELLSAVSPVAAMHDVARRLCMEHDQLKAEKAELDGPEHEHCAVNNELVTIIRGITDEAKVHVPFLDDAVRTLLAERNEAREWVERMHKETQVLTCVYCGTAYPPGTPASGSDVLTAHIKVCEKHPMREVEMQLAAALREIEQLKAGRT